MNDQSRPIDMIGRRSSGGEALAFPCGQMGGLDVLALELAAVALRQPELGGIGQQAVLLLDVGTEVRGGGLPVRTRSLPSCRAREILDLPRWFDVISSMSNGPGGQS